MEGQLATFTSNANNLRIQALNLAQMVNKFVGQSKMQEMNE